MPFEGFPRGVRSIPVPGPLFGTLLEEIDSLAELKCTLRAIWLLHQKRGYPRFVTLRELQADSTLARAVGGASPAEEIEQALARAVRRGTLAFASVQKDGETHKLYALNTEADRKALAAMAGGQLATGPLPRANPWEGPATRPNIYALYEDNIGMLSPMIADELRQAEQRYPQEWIEDAFREAVGQNKRNWRYIARILERWEREGRSNGEPGRYSKKAGYY